MYIEGKNQVLNFTLFNCTSVLGFTVKFSTMLPIFSRNFDFMVVLLIFFVASLTSNTHYALSSGYDQT